ncbi:hypothetical protein BC832DRAFT_352017 [Gaertneriomyces semiglobifer]|nr:hypothetical protein BC832DRAFT_352017 [Gaertneriomyces semiglobifer]
MDKMDMSLDDIITTKKHQTKKPTHKPKKQPVVGGGVGKLRGRAAPYQKPTPRNSSINGKWQHDKFPGVKRDFRGQAEDLRQVLSQPPSGAPRSGLGASRSGLSIAGASQVQDATTIKVENLHPAVNEADLKTIVSGYGKVITITLKPAPQTRHSPPTTTAYITYSSRAAATTAIQKLNNQVADGLVLRVSEVESSLSIAGVAQQVKKQKQPVLVTPAARDFSNGKTRLGGRVGGMYADRIAQQQSPAGGRLVNRLGKKGTTFSVSL